MRVFTLLMAFVSSACFFPGLRAVAAEDKSKAGQKRYLMDYGPFLSATVQLPGETSAETPKGIVVRVGDAQEGNLLYDTDLMRCTGGWTGGFINYRGVVFDGSHGPNPGPEGMVLFRTARLPGWSRNGDSNDPRELPKGPGAATVPYGPLPADWAHYRGLHRNGKQVVLDYTVGEAEILELPGVEKLGAQSALTRSFEVVKAGAGSTLLVAEVLPGATLDEQEGCLVLADDPRDASSRLVVRLVDGPQGARWKWIAPGRLGLELPGLVAGARFKLAFWKGTEAAQSAALALMRAVEAAPELLPLTKPGPLLWPELIEAKGSLGKEEGAYQLDSIGLPVQNPWQSWIRPVALDFFKDGRVAFSTLNGDVWVGSGLDRELQRIRWKRFAAGLHQPLGLRIVHDTVYVTCRDGIMRLQDLNGDGEADFYENFNGDVQVTPGFHEFMFDLQTDSEGNFYFSKGGPVKGGGRGFDPLSDHSGTMMRVTPDGSKLEVFATGVRAPNGMAIGPDDTITVGDNEGTWVPQCYLHVVKKGSFVSVPDLAHRETVPSDFDPHVCFFPKDVDNSSGGQVWVTSKKWGPMKGRLLHLSYGQASLYEVMMEDAGGVLQGGVSRVPLKFATGLFRARFSPADGQLYVCGMRGWQTSGTEEGALQRVRYTNKPHYAPKALHVNDRGIRIDFHVPLDRESATNLDNYSIEQWNYRWSSYYGSQDYRLSNPEEIGRDLVDIRSVRLSKDRTSVFLEVPGLQPVMQSEISMHIKSASGVPMPERIVHTINSVPHEPTPLTPLPGNVAETVPVPRTMGGGVAMTVEVAGKKDVRKERLIALHVPDGAPVSPFLPNDEYVASWDAVLMNKIRKTVSFIAEGNGWAKVVVNGEILIDGVLYEGPISERQEAPVELRKGGNVIHVEYRSPESGPSNFRFLWSAADFAPEPVPPAVLNLPEDFPGLTLGTQLREGRMLFAQSKCVACHDPKDVLQPAGTSPFEMPELSRPAPLLSELGKRVRKEWVAQWILNPHQFRPGSLMPAVLHREQAPQQAADLAALLTAQGVPEELTQKGSAAEGGRIFANLGCIACHSSPASNADRGEDRVPLHHVSAKWHAAALRDFLLDPLRDHPGSRMPRVPLSEQEALDLTAFLMEFPKVELAPAPEGDMARGAALLQSQGCVQCHGGVPGTAPALKSFVDASWGKGCLADEAQHRGAAPDFDFQPQQREALRVFAKSGVAAVEQDSAREFAQRAVNDLRCTACHRLDGRQSTWVSVSEEARHLGGLREGPKASDPHAPRFTNILPQLTWLGEKLQPDWSERFIAGELKEKPRPYLYARMPAYPRDARKMAAGLSHWHGYSDVAASPREKDGELAKAGQVLLSENGGFACTGCHALGERRASAPFEAPALNLAWVPQRLRLSYYERWLLQPQRLDPDTKMPRYSDAEARTQLKEILDGDARRQFDAIRKYLLTLEE